MMSRVRTGLRIPYELSTPVIKCKKTPVKKCSFLAIRNVM